MRDGQHTAPYTEQDAIVAALSQHWTTAIEINSQLLKQDEQNVGILNRLGYAYLKSGELTKAKKMFQKVLTIDPYNQIALKNSKLAGTTKGTKMPDGNGNIISPLLFLEEPGKTKIAACINTAQADILANVSPGQEVSLRAKNHCVEVRSHHDVYLGALPDDLSFKLIKLLEAGNTYQTLIKSVGKNALSVIIRELTRGKRFAQQPSFITVTSSYSTLGGVGSKSSDKPDVTPTGETEDEEPQETVETE